MSLGLLALLLSLFLDLEVFEALDFHHEVELLFLFAVLLLEDFLFLQLLVADGDALRVQKHRVHLLHRVLLFVQRVLRLARDVFLLLPRLLRELVRHFVLAVSVHFHHLLLPRLRCCQLLLLLLFQKFLVLQLLFFRSDNRVVFNAVQLCLRNDDCVCLLPFLDLLPDFSQLVLRNYCCACFLGPLLISYI